MNRCVICDCVEGHSNEYLHKYQGFNRVRRRGNGEYLCDECNTSIQLVMYDDEERNQYEILEEWLSQPTETTTKTASSTDT